MTGGEKKTEAKEQAKSGAIGCGVIALAVVLLVATCSLSQDPSVDELPEPPDVGSASPDTQRAVQQFSAAASEAMSQCDLAGRVLAETAASFDAGDATPYDAYDSASLAAKACEAEWLAFDDLTIPGEFETAVRVRAEDAREKCGLYLFARKKMAETAMQMFNGDVSPATANKLQDDASFMNGQQSQCASALVAVPLQAGVAPPTEN